MNNSCSEEIQGRNNSVHNTKINSELSVSRKEGTILKYIHKSFIELKLTQVTGPNHKVAET
jgi:hypothetical protein